MASQIAPQLNAQIKALDKIRDDFLRSQVVPIAELQLDRWVLATDSILASLHVATKLAPITALVNETITDPIDKINQKQERYRNLLLSIIKEQKKGTTSISVVKLSG